MRAAPWILALAAVAAPVASTRAQVLEPGAPLAVELPAGETIELRLPLDANHTFRLSAEQRGADLMLEVLDPVGQRIAAADSPDDSQAAEILVFRTALSGGHTVRVRSHRQTASRLMVEELAVATAADRRRLAAESAWTRAGELYLEHTADGFRRAIEELERAAAAFREVGDPRRRVRALYSIGILYRDIDEPDRGLEYLQQALSRWGALGVPHGEANALNALGSLHYRVGRYSQASLHFERAIDLRRDLRDLPGQAQTLANIGLVHHRQGEPRRALTAYSSALSLARRARDIKFEARMLINMGGVHQVLGELQDALSTYERALAPLRDLDERQLVGITLNNMGTACRGLGEYQKALTYYYQAVEVRREMGDQRRLATSFNSIGFTTSTWASPGGQGHT